MKNLLELVMIVRDAQSVIVKTLRAIKPYIDHWTILDTGSVDNTPELIRKEMRGKPGQLYREPFVDFATSRNRVLELARSRREDKCKYTIMLDDSYVLMNGKKLIKFLKQKIPAEVYYIAIRDDLDRLYYSGRILKTNSRLKYKYRVHEVIDYQGGVAIDFFLSGIYIHDYKDIISKERTEARYRQDINFLMQDLQDYPNDTRVIYYLGNTFYSMKEFTLAKKYYHQRIEMKDQGVEDEVYQSYYLLGVIHEEEGDWEGAQKYYLLSAKQSPTRAEPLYRLGVKHYQAKSTRVAYEYLKKAFSMKIPQETLYQLEIDTYTTAIPFLYADVCLKLKKLDEAKDAIERGEKANPERFANLKSSLTDMLECKDEIQVTKTAQALVVFHTEDPLDPEKVGKVGSGSEIMLIGLAEALSRRDWKVVVFGKVTNRTHKGVEYQHLDGYRYFLRRYYVDALIVSRYGRNMVYYPSVMRVYLWLHDLIPQGESFQTHAEKFKGILCLSEWHKRFFSSEYNFPLELIHSTRNAINPKEFEQPLEKEPFRFIYVSEARRGLNHLLDLIPKIKSKYPETTLHIFSQDVPAPLLKKIRLIPYVHLHPRVTHARMIQEFLKSDFWLYPTEWRETYCISALEAQMARVLCICSSVGALPETVGDRGIVINAKPGTDEFETKFFEEFDRVVEYPLIKQDKLSRAEDWARKQTFDVLAEDWEDEYLL